MGCDSFIDVISHRYIVVGSNDHTFDFFCLLTLIFALKTAD